MLYVLEGTMLAQIGEERHELGAGGFAWIPLDTPHTWLAATTPAAPPARPGAVTAAVDHPVHMASTR